MKIPSVSNIKHKRYEPSKMKRKTFNQITIIFSLGKAGERFVVSILLLLLFDIKWFSSLNY